MARRSRADRRREQGTSAPPGGEWLGGRLAPPFFITDAEQPYRAQIALWLELPLGLIVGQEVTAPANAGGALGRVLLAALERPLIGPVRRPSRIRVADEELAAEVRGVVGDRIPVRVAPTPELDEVLESMIESMSSGAGEEPSYLEDGRISEEIVAEFFAAAEYLYRVAPWRIATDDQVVRVDVPELRIQGACLSIIGALGESLGIVLFPSLADYEAFSPEVPAPPRRRIELGSSCLRLCFERGADLPSRMRREIDEHGWPVAAAEAYPILRQLERDGASRPLAERDFRVASACARALASFFVRNPRSFAPDETLPASESFSDDLGPTVRITAPYAAFSLFEVENERPAGLASQETWAPRPGRNDPCPCGSGRKYKRCHLRDDERTGAEASRGTALHVLDQRLVDEISAFAFAHFGGEARGWVRDFDDPAGALSLSMPWSVYHFCVRGRPAFEWFLEEGSPRLKAEERRWLDAQRASWLSVWEVSEVRAGEGLTLHDLLTEEERRVKEVLGSETLVKRDCILARVVELDGASVLGGTHPRPLPPTAAAEIVRRARGRLRRKRAVPADRLRDEGLGRYLIRRWEEAVVELDMRRSGPPALRNTDGEPLVLTTDHYDIVPGRGGDVAARIAALDGVLSPDPDDANPSYDFLRTSTPGGSPARGDTLLGSIRIARDRLRVATNSIARADALRQRVEEACGDLVRHRTREHVDPLSEPLRKELAERPPEEPPPEARQFILDFKRSRYATWLDEPLPALGGKSPRQAARSPTGRGAADALLKEMENLEERLPMDERFDFSELRRQLELDD